MTAPEILAAISARQISLTPAFDGKFWTASVDENGNNLTSKSRKVKMISATAATASIAVAALVETLDAERQQNCGRFTSMKRAVSNAPNPTAIRSIKTPPAGACCSSGRVE